MNSQRKVQDLEERCERLQMSLDACGRESEAREREVREGMYGSTREDVGGDEGSELRFPSGEMPWLGYDHMDEEKQVRCSLAFGR